MLSKQRTKKLFNNQYNEWIDNTREDVAKSRHIMTSTVKITSVRIKNDKYYMIKLPTHNPLKKSVLRQNINKIPRPNYENGSIDMYRMVNGLCHYCGHNEYQATMSFYEKGNILTNIVCTECGKKQPFNSITNYNAKLDFDRGKDYAKRQINLRKKLLKNKY